MRQSAEPSELTCCGRSGDGPLACRCAGRWEKACGRSEPICPATGRRVLICVYGGCLVALHGFIKKTRATPEHDLTLARKRQKELEQ